MNKTWIKEHWLEILLCVGIVIQIGALAVFNLTRLPYESNYDSSCAYAQIVEMWRQKRILLKDWAYQTTLGIDSPVLLGALFYGITKNAFTAFGLANIVTVIVYAFLFYDILKQADVKKKYASACRTVSSDTIQHRTVRLYADAFYQCRFLCV